MNTIGSFVLIKNEKPWIRAHILSWLPWLDEMVFFDGNSTDGTLEEIEEIQNKHTFGKRVKLFRNKDPKDLKDDYVRLFNECLHSLSTDYAFFLHPDMLLDDPGDIQNLGDGIAYFTHMRSFAGEPDGQLYEIKEGRTDRWKNIYRLKNPDLGLHYFGHYGAKNEDCYFSQITGGAHQLYTDLKRYPYPVLDSGIKILHYSDVRPLPRRIDRMHKCLINQGYPEKEASYLSVNHPRVTFKEGLGFSFKPAEYHPLLQEANV